MRTLGSEKRLLLYMISVMIVIIFLHIIYYSTKLIPNNFFHDIRLTIYEHNVGESQESGESLDSGPYLIKTSDCSIPETPLFPAYFADDWRIDNIPDCNYEIKNFLTMDEDEFVTFFPREVDEMCCLQEIIPNRTKYSLSECNYFNAGTTLSVHDKEMFAVTCNKSINVDATFPIKPKVQVKLDFWKTLFEKDRGEWNNNNIQKKPPNILILMVDSVSRLHAHRSIPKTLSLLKELNFMEFKGFHSVGSNTLLNLIPLLLGQTLNEVRQTCSPNWTSPFDTCPFIWNKFENYITNFIEDGEGSFSWGGQGGFKSPPTDYNIPQLFQALNHLRLKSFSPGATWFTKEMYADCVSSESIPDFVLRYTQRFITKFSDVPFFSFSLFAYPFHEHLYSLAGFDDSLHDFFETFSSMSRLDSESENIFENTLILFLSDHGDRTSEHSSSVEGFIERSLPLFYMKLPKIFQEEFPHQSFWINAVKNTKRLITPWDIHETLLHTANLFQSPSKSGSTSPSSTSMSMGSLGDLSMQSQNDRSSLFHVIPSNRDCSTVNIPAQTCVCDTMMMMMTMKEDESTKGERKVKVGRKNPLILQNTVTYLSNELNRIVENSKYQQVCRKWTTDPSKILIFRQMNDRWIDSKSENETEYFVSFSAHPGDAKFEGRLLISNELKIQGTFNIEEIKQEHDNNNNLMYDIKLVGPLSRVSSYRNQSFCIPFETDFDKEMKQFCVCKTD